VVWQCVTPLSLRLDLPMAIRAEKFSGFSIQSVPVLKADPTLQLAVTDSMRWSIALLLGSVMLSSLAFAFSSQSIL